MCPLTSATPRCESCCSFRAGWPGHGQGLTCRHRTAGATQAEATGPDLTAQDTESRTKRVEWGVRVNGGVDGGDRGEMGFCSGRPENVWVGREESEDPRAPPQAGEGWGLLSPGKATPQGLNTLCPWLHLLWSLGRPFLPHRRYLAVQTGTVPGRMACSPPPAPAGSECAPRRPHATVNAADVMCQGRSGRSTLTDHQHSCSDRWDVLPPPARPLGVSKAMTLGPGEPSPGAC